MSLTVGICNWSFTSRVDRSILPYFSLTTVAMWESANTAGVTRVLTARPMQMMHDVKAGNLDATA